MAKMLPTMKDTVRFTEENVDIAIESKAKRLNNADEKKKKENFRKELSEKKKSLSQLLFMC